MRRTIAISFSILALTAMAAASQAVERRHGTEAEAVHPAAPAHDAKPHWTYGGDGEGPAAWGDLAEEFALCKKGHMQSPVDLGGAAVAGGFNVRTTYAPAPLVLLNNGHTVQVNVPEGSTLTSGISRYKLLQVHFHTPSEETIYGIHYPMVAHFVHVDYAGNYAVLGILFEEGAPNAELEKLVKAAPHFQTAAVSVKGVTFNPGGLLPTNLAVYRYEGSLTTPPCTEGVRWHVATHRVTASASQIAALNAIMGDNARPVQPLYGRLLVAGAD